MTNNFINDCGTINIVTSNNYQIVKSCCLYSNKKITILADKPTHIIMTDGNSIIDYDNKCFLLHKNESTYISKNLEYSITNNSDNNIYFILVEVIF